MDVIDMDEASKHLLNDIRGNIFIRGVSNELDELSDTIQHQLLYLKDVVSHLGGIAGDVTMCKLDCNDRDGYFLSSTKKRWNTIHSKLSDEDAKKFHVRPISNVSNTLRITSFDIDNASDKIVKSQAKISSIVQEKYIDFLRFFVDKNASSIETIAYAVAHIDVQTTNAMNACEYHYKKPTILETSESISKLEIKQLRHPIIERIQQKIDYVANDVSITPSQSGLLLYGVNASGKSSLMKAIGLAIIMAQSGMYVPCDELIFVPYTNIFTRISGNDNIYQGMSSFAVEMTELKNILIRADSRSLVLGDELCAGTESVSALSIVASGIEILLKKKAGFVFATHLHELLSIPEIESHIEKGDVQVAHMHTEIKDGRIVYDRTLRKGSGADTYGIEVCRGLGMPQEFMQLAEKFRKFVKKENNHYVSTKHSRYNANVHIDVCQICKKYPATETHHIRYQEDADDKGFIKNNHIHKNTQSNLVPLCNQCHLMEHHGSLNGNRQQSV
jgi:DNA mismatch repair protein MutS